MRRLLLLVTSIALAASSQGCCKHLCCNHTAGACDCYAPPVETLLQAPCPKPYAPAPYAPVGQNLPSTLHVQPAPTTTDQPPPKESETIKVPPKLIEKDKEK
jgi:hypothetical protein